MPAPILKFKRGSLSALPGLQAGEPGWVTDTKDLFVGIDSTTGNNQIVGSARYWQREGTTTGSGVKLVEGTNNGANAITIEAPATIGSDQTYTFPAVPTNGGYLRVNGSGTMTWDTGSGWNGGAFPLSGLDIDGGTDIGANIVDADEFIVDDGGGGTNRKTDAVRIKDYVLGRVNSNSAGAALPNLQVTGIQTSAFNHLTTLTVSGVTTTAGLLDANNGINASTVKVEDLTNNRIVIAGTGGELEDDSKFTFDGSTFTVDGTATVTGTVNANAVHLGAEGVAMRMTSDTISGPALITIDPAAVGNDTGKVVIAGDLQVDGTTTTINSTVMQVDDKNLELGTGAADDAAADGGGITVISGEGNKTFKFEATGDNWESSENFDLASGKVFKVANSEVLSATALSTNVVVDIASININGATDLGAEVVGTDEFILSDGGGETNRKTDASRIKDYVLGGGQGARFPQIRISGITTAAFVDSTNLKVSGIATFSQAIEAPDIRQADGGLIPLMGAIKNTGSAGLVTAFKFSGGGIDSFTVSGGIADVVTTGIAATTYVSNQQQTLTQGQTAVNIAAGYEVGFVDIYMNGVRLQTGTDYIQTNSNTITLTQGATVGDEIESIAWKTLGTVASLQDLTVANSLTVTGDLTVEGTTTQINTVNTSIEDTLLELQKVDGAALSSDTNKDVGLVMNYYDGSAKKAAFYWDDSAAKFVLLKEGSETSGVMTPTTYGALEIGSLWLNDCAGAHQVISCSGTTRSLNDITVDGGAF